MTVRFVSTLTPAPPGFAAGQLTKKTLLAAPLVLLTQDLEAVFRVVPEGRQRIEGVLVTLGAPLRRERLGDLLWSVTVPENELPNLREVLAAMLEAIESAVAYREKMVEATRLAARAQNDLRVTRRDYNELSSKLLEDLERSRTIAAENARLYAEAQDALQARDEFLSVASHELKTPLTPLKLHLQSMQRLLEKSEDRKLETHVAKANSHVDRLTRLIETLLDVSAVSRGQMRLRRQRIDLFEIVREVVHRLDRSIELSGSIVRIRGAPLFGDWDRFRLEQLVTNLLSNAIKFGGGKPIDLSVEPIDDRGARLVIADRGMGIDPARRQRLFERFERAVSAREFGGLGLGLYVTREIVEAHGGTVTLDSELGAGTTVTVELPLTPPDSLAG